MKLELEPRQTGFILFTTVSADQWVPVLTPSNFSINIYWKYKWIGKLIHLNAIHAQLLIGGNWAWYELTHWKRLWCWEGLGAEGKGDDRGWDGWMASPTRRTWVWVNSGSWCWTGRPGVLRFMGLQRVGHDWATELNWNWAWYKRVVIDILLAEIYSGEDLEKRSPKALYVICEENLTRC